MMTANQSNVYPQLDTIDVWKLSEPATTGQEKDQGFTVLEKD